MSLRQNIAFLPLLAATLLLAGCASSSAGSAEPEPSETPSPSPSAEAVVVSTIAVGGTGLELLGSDDSTLESVPYTSDPAAAIATLSEAFGIDPVITDRPAGPSCTPQATQATWADGFVLRYDIQEGWVPSAQLFQVDATIGSVESIAIETSAGVGVGGSAADLTADLAPEQVGVPADIEGVAVNWVDYDVASGEYAAETDPGYGSADYWGATARTDDDVVSRIIAPTVFVNLC